MTEATNNKPNPAPPEDFRKKEDSDKVLNSNSSSNSSDPNDWCPAQGPHPSD